LVYKRISQINYILTTEQKEEKYGTVTQEEINFNQEHAKKRIRIEHTICKLKKFRILAYVFRNELRRYNQISDIV
jgi:DDE superfamily endonuclease